MNNPNELSGSLHVQRCPFVGLHDDPGTCLAYPSLWNYCYRAKPPASTEVSHQATACLSPDHIHCPVFMPSQRAPLPASLRGVMPRQKFGSGKRANILLLLVLFFLLGLAALFLNQRLGLVHWGEPGTSNVILSVPDTPSHSVSRTPTRSGFLPQSFYTTRSVTMTATPSHNRTATSTLIAIHQATKTPTLSLTPIPFPVRTSSPTFPVVGVCGHALDSAFGGEVQFVLHRVLSGENLNLYADTYHTTTSAILAVNYRLPVPVWENWIIVIPVETSVTSGIPPFETYQALGTVLSLEDLASELNTDAKSLQEYNDFEGPCKSYSGWILVPREADSG